MKVWFGYLKYVVKHRWLVLLAAIELGILWRGLVHDLSKFSRAEWGPYKNWFFTDQGSKFNGGFAWEFGVNEQYHKDFKQAWLHHIHVNPHHWEYWIIPGKEECLEIPEVYCKEMVADWMGMSRARGKADCSAWYESQIEVIKLHPNSRKQIETFIRCYGVNKDWEPNEKATRAG
jgi:hypothetical protein